MKINTHIKSTFIILFILIFIAAPLKLGNEVILNTCNAQSGCCSWHGGVSGCDYDTGRQVCNDNTYSPSCGCSIIRKPSCSIGASPQTITWGQSTSLNWNSGSGSNLSSSSFGASSANGTKAVNPLVSTTYSLSVSNVRGSSPCQVAVTVTPKVEIKDETVIEAVTLPDKIIDDPEQLKDKETVVDAGVVGSKDIYYKVTYTNNVETTRAKSGEKVTIEPLGKVIKRGTKEPVQYYLGVTKKNVKDNYLVYSVILLIILGFIGSHYSEQLHKIIDKGKKTNK